MNTPTKSQIFTAAWTRAKAEASRTGISSKAHFPGALRSIYANVRSGSFAPIRTAPAAKTTIEKVDYLAAELDIRIGRGTFAWRFIADSSTRVAKYGAATKFSAKQVAVINDLFARYA